MSLIQKTAVEIVELLKKDQVTPLDLLEALEKRIDKIDKKVNALPIRCFDRARTHAKKLMEKPINKRGILAGLPVAIKDLTPVANVRFTSGSMLFENNIAQESDPLVEAIEEQGGIIYAKSNTPEFGAGGNTFNDVFGATLNPWDSKKSVAGSSGGAAAALASGTAWLAHGSDLGGSLRNPASFCGIVGLRPSPGRIQAVNTLLPFQNLGVQGPMARNVADISLFLDTMTGQTPFSPLSTPSPKRNFFTASQAREKPQKVAFSSNLGYMPVETEVAEICKKAAIKLQDQGVVVEEIDPDVENVLETFWTLRSNLFASLMGDLLEHDQTKLMPELVENIKEGLNMTSKNVREGEIARGKIFNTMARFFEEYDLLLAPSTIVPPFPVGNRYVESCGGHKFTKYVDWLGIAFLATLASCPSMSLPAGKNSEGLPIGLQIIGPNRGEETLLSAAQYLEDLLGQSPVPIDPQ